MTTSKNNGTTRAGWPRLAVAGLIGVAAGAAAGLVQPLGPVTAIGAVGLMAGAGAVGLAAGFLSRTRWAYLLAPLGFIVAFELVRDGDGLPTTGPLQFDTAFGPVAFALGHLVPLLLTIVPLIVGAAWGAWAASGRTRRPVWLGIAAMLTALLGAALLIPPTAPPVTGADGRPQDSSLAELVPVEIGGHEQWIEVRGARADLPVLLYLSGGPGQSDLAYSRVLLEPLTTDFLVVGWDQRGTGKSYPALDPDTLTLEQAVADTIELTRWLTQHYGQQKVYLLGESWGSLLGVLAVKQAPELFHAYLGSGQMVDPLETDETIYRDLIIAAMATGDGELVARLTAMARPPYPSVFEYATIMMHYPMLEGAYSPPAATVQRAANGNVGPMGVLGREYGPIDKLNVVRGLLDMFAVMYPQLQDVDLRRDAATLEVPVYLFMGEHELTARSEPARAWFDQLQAPDKKWYTLPDAGHAAVFEQADQFHQILVELADATTA